MDVNSVKALSAYQNSSRTSKAAEEVVETKQAKDAKKLLETPAGVLVEGSPSAVYEKSDIIKMMQNDATIAIANGNALEFRICCASCG